MDSEIAIEFLKNHQPLNPDKELGEEIKTFDDVRRYFASNYDVRCIELLLNAFGDGDGFGVYQLVEDTIQVYPHDLVIPILNKALLSPHRSVRYWNSQIAALFPDERLVGNLKLLLLEDFDIRFHTTVALLQINSPKTRNILLEHLGHEEKSEIRELITGSVTNQ